MTTFEWIVTLLWLVFLGYWFVAAWGTKKNGRGIRRGLVVRVVVVIVVLFVLRGKILRPWLEHPTALAAHPIVNSIGVAVCACGIALAIWARRHLGRNWGMPMSIKVEPELITSGPYAHVRHPIYTGMLIAMLGTAIAGASSWLVLFVLFGSYFLYSATVEEQTMQQRFPSQYAEYRRRTKMLIPFVI